MWVSAGKGTASTGIVCSPSGSFVQRSVTPEFHDCTVFFRFLGKDEKRLRALDRRAANQRLDSDVTMVSFSHNNATR